ncbi:MAG: methyltransferase domain-containing protein [Chloroflexi bacterium]|nr:MAG: methyltransferase domain-containing protein [Chloroflexota bacterium]
MSEYLNFHVDYSNPDVVSAYDEISLWSAMFGQMLLERIPMRRGMVVLDIGYGTGFPAIELALRLGASCKVYGIDPWEAARKRAEFKARHWGVKNLELLTGDAAAMPFENEQFDLLVSNLGVNNFADPPAVLGECRRVAKTGARLVLTTNLVGHMQEFYDVFEATLRQLGEAGKLPQEEHLARLREHIAHRASVEGLAELFAQAGFRVTSTHRQEARMRFLDGSALFRHTFIQRGFLDGWMAVVEPGEREEVFTCLEANLNRSAEERGELSLTIPMAYVEAEKA